jgi:hypothetical protein
MLGFQNDDENDDNDDKVMMIRMMISEVMIG